MHHAVQIGRITGIPIRIHYTWLIVFGLFSWMLATGYFRDLYPNISTTSQWTAGIMASFLLFLSVLLHELGHSYVAQRLDISIASITLFAFGGVAELKAEPPSAKAEFQIAIAGPVVSLLLALSFQLLSKITPVVMGTMTIVGAMLYLLKLNVWLAMFNLIPAFPLDGGRVFRSGLWWWLNDLTKATRIATGVGQGFAYLLIAYGVFSIRHGFQGLWLIVIGLFLLQAAQSGYHQSLLRSALSGVKVNDIMARDLVTIDARCSVESLVNEYFLVYGYGGFPVVLDSEIVGVVSLSDVKAVDRADWKTLSVGDIMDPIEDRLSIRPDEDATVALNRMIRDEISRLVVVQDHQLRGLLTKKGISRFLQIKMELGR